MKKTVIIILVLLITAFAGIGIVNNANGESVSHEEYLRIHIRANSNSEEDQTVKYKVKEAVVDYLTPFLSSVRTKKEAEELLKNKMAEIESVSDKVLKSNGFTYNSKGEVRNEEFPTRVYEDLTLNKGYYDALIIELGEGEGDNWWCVVYPPLCFLSSNASYIYKSKIKEIIDNFFAK